MVQKFLQGTLFVIMAFIISIVMVFGFEVSTIQAVTATETAVTDKNASEVFAASETTETATDGEADHAAEDGGVIGMVGINWKLFLAQLINFSIVLFVLWKWVFGPVARALEKRTAKIESSLKEAERISTERETFDSWKQGEISEVRKEAAVILSNAKAETDTIKTEALNQTKLEQEKIIGSVRMQLDEEKQAMIEQVKTELAVIVVSATQIILQAKLDPKKDSELIASALKKVEVQK